MQLCSLLFMNIFSNLYSALQGSILLRSALVMMLVKSSELLAGLQVDLYFDARVLLQPKSALHRDLEVANFI